MIDPQAFQNDPAFDWDCCDEHETTFLIGATCPECDKEDDEINEKLVQMEPEAMMTDLHDKILALSWDTPDPSMFSRQKDYFQGIQEGHTIAKNQAAELASSHEQDSGWISVNSSLLPIDGEEVYFYTDILGVCEGQFNSGYPGHHVYIGNNGIMIENATHWMPHTEPLPPAR